MPKSQAEVRGHVLRVFSDTGMETKRGNVAGSVESLSYGFGFGTVRFTGVVETLLVSSVTPIDGERVDVRFSFSIKKLGGADVTRGVGAAFINEVARQLEQDIPIWEHKTQWIAQYSATATAPWAYSANGRDSSTHNRKGLCRQPMAASLHRVTKTIFEPPKTNRQGFLAVNTSQPGLYHRPR